MSLAAETACAVRAVNAYAYRLPASDYPPLAELWRELDDLIEDSRSEGAAELAVIEWRANLRERMAGRLAEIAAKTPE